VWGRWIDSVAPLRTNGTTAAEVHGYGLVQIVHMEEWSATTACFLDVACSYKWLGCGVEMINLCSLLLIPDQPPTTQRWHHKRNPHVWLGVAHSVQEGVRSTERRGERFSAGCAVDCPVHQYHDTSNIRPFQNPGGGDFEHWVEAQPRSKSLYNENIYGRRPKQGWGYNLVDPILRNRVQIVCSWV
jgi:hypothetical protein